MKLLLLLTSAIALPSFAASGGDLQASDLTGVSFWLVTAALLAATVFYFVERDNVSSKWKTSLTVSGLVTGIAFWHYMYMRGVWIETGDSPTVFRYIDWLLTVPLLICEFYLILAAATNVAGSLFKKLLVGSLVMLAYNTMMWIIIVGWAIYPAGYAAGYLMGGEGVYASNLNIVYNLADFVNKILFGLVIWHVAVKESASA